MPLSISIVRSSPFANEVDLNDRAGCLLINERPHRIVVVRGEGRGGTSVRFTAVDIFEFDSRGFVGKLRSLYDTAGVAALMRADRAAASQGGV